ncbi:MAG: glutamate synthase subunit beta [Candidatus Omnitrophica bacterium]|nr:glutamate synthase subunit beta [Candidatus Omnitrophota bacterium]
MAKKDLKGFLNIQRKASDYRPVEERIKDYKDVVKYRSDEESQAQAVRCMDCGTPFCHWGCPVCNLIPEWNSYLVEGNWRKAYDLLASTNNFPEITGRICPALCESACVLGINNDPITIRENELAIIEKAFKEGYVKSVPNGSIPSTGKKVAVVGSGPAGLTVADQLNKKGHDVTVFERADKLGGFMRYGIPDFKLEKWVIDRRTDLMENAGIKFKTSCNVGEDIKVEDLMKDFDAVLLSGGSRQPRDLDIPGRDTEGIYFAVDYLTQANKMSAGHKMPKDVEINAKDKKVIVIGGGDTGSDCIGTANRQGAKSISQIEVMPKPSETRTEDYPWPFHPLLLKETSSHKEGSERDWSILTKEFISEGGKIKKLKCVKVEFIKKAPGSRPSMVEIPGSEFEMEADMIILAIGFLHPERKDLLDHLKVEFDERGNVKTFGYKTSVNKVFACGDMRRGQSLIVWAIQEGREASEALDDYLK